MQDIQRDHLHIHFDARQCHFAATDQAWLQQELQPVVEAVKDLASAELWLTLIYHPRSDAYHIDAKLQVPGRTFSCGEREAHLDLALQHCVHKLIQQMEAHSGCLGRAE
jgi:hypothetical protein